MISFRVSTGTSYLYAKIKKTHVVNKENSCFKKVYIGKYKNVWMHTLVKSMFEFSSTEVKFYGAQRHIRT